ncbi:hypothetical protein [Sulfurovum sp.]|uniref:hypothetical protein n=1 Tax=Sulfurovum sp. TaxID=1969726 RepID=UPI0025E6E9FE|nr:hypothetical protein [Sulfurovum sp.]
MNSNIIFRFVLLALFLFAYQTTTIHSKHHFIEGLSECQVCKAAKTLGATHHETSFILFDESIAIEVGEVEEKRIVNASYDLTQIPDRKAINFEGMSVFDVDRLPLGYHTTAPPYFFS